MPIIHEVATVTSKGQITLPKPIRQALGVDVGGKVAFDFSGDTVTVRRVSDDDHADPSISKFLEILENDINSGRHITSLPVDLAASMVAALREEDRDQDANACEIDGDVDL